MVGMFSLQVQCSKFEIIIFYLNSCIYNFVCKIGREFFVGISDRTNLAGARAVAAGFPEFPCTPVKVI